MVSPQRQLVPEQSPVVHLRSSCQASFFICCRPVERRLLESMRRRQSRRSSHFDSVVTTYNLLAFFFPRFFVFKVGWSFRYVLFTCPVLHHPPASALSPSVALLLKRSCFRSVRQLLSFLHRLSPALRRPLEATRQENVATPVGYEESD